MPGQSFQRLYGVSRLAAYLYHWSEQIAMIAGVWTLAGIGVAVGWPLSNLTDGTLRPFGFYFRTAGLVVLPPFLVLVIAAVVHNRMYWKYRELIDAP